MPEAQHQSAAILIVDDEESALRSVRRTLRTAGFERVLTCNDSREAVATIGEERISLVLLDLIMPHRSGEDVLAEIVKLKPDLPVIVVTAEYEVQTAVHCMKLGAIDYLLKPVDGEQLVAAVQRALEESALRYEASRLREQFFLDRVERAEAFADIVTNDEKMLRLFAYLEAISRGSHPVLISGETGTGKELIARALHDVSGRAGPFVAVNVAGLDDTMFSDTLFGHAAGAFTGADTERAGMIERAGEGTLFLDEIGDLSESSQVKLLRLLQEREYYPLGSDSPKRMAARVVAATHKDLGTLRQDLYYRLRSYHARIPALRERLGDLQLLVEHFLASAAADLQKPKPTVPPELYVYLSNYDFPGNVRELQSMVFDAVARHEGGVMPLQPFLEHAKLSDERQVGEDEVKGEIRFPFPMPSLRQIETAAVEEAMDRVQGNQSAAARMLGVSRPTVARHLRAATADGDAG